ncbi:ABC transporter permease [Mycoplasma sp. Ms02]|uniref:ABC transporter permease n=1 Tax=Mycoplasma sp. Ms02 TaxID=353851 RepID=UPI001C899C37|nr:ABC transporter permease [Mycoplasma sp. Ms02]QZE12543.1 ABC transporter permease [Mycoplasma sp. Ms02]
MNINYLKFLNKIELKRINTYVIALILFIFNLSIFVISKSSGLSSIWFSISWFATLLLTLILASLKFVKILSELESEGLDLLVLSKPIARKRVIASKIGWLTLFGFVWSVFATLTFIFTIVAGDIAITNLIWVFVAVFLCYLIFGSIASLVAYKFSQKLSTIIPISIFIPLTFGGAIISSTSTSELTEMTNTISRQSKNTKSGIESDTNGFFLNKEKSPLYLMPNGYENNKFKDFQNEYLEEATKASNSGAKKWQTYSSWAVPYQMFNLVDSQFKGLKDVLAALQANESKVIYNPVNTSLNYHYELREAQNLLKVNVSKVEGTELLKYVVPNTLKNSSVIDGLVNTNIIYARKGASDFNLNFPEDSYGYANPNNLVGEIQWSKLASLLSDSNFALWAQEVLDGFETKDKSAQEIKNDFLNLISTKTETEGVYLQGANPESPISDDAIKTKYVKNQTEQKVYIATALIHYAYFAQYNDIIKSLITNDNNVIQSQPLTISIDGYDYQIGGYEKYVVKQKVENDEIKVRYELTESQNNLFYLMDEVKEFAPTSKVVNHELQTLLWLTIALVLVFANFSLYTRKDYR